MCHVVAVLVPVLRLFVSLLTLVLVGWTTYLDEVLLGLRLSPMDAMKKDDLRQLPAGHKNRLKKKGVRCLAWSRLESKGFSFCLESPYILGWTCSCLIFTKTSLFR